MQTQRAKVHEVEVRSDAGPGRTVACPRRRPPPRAAVVVSSLIAVAIASPARAQSRPADAPTSAAPAAAPAAIPAAAPRPAAAPTEKPDAGARPATARSNVPAYVAMGFAGAGVVVGTIFGVSALGAHSDFAAAPTTDNADKTDRRSLIADVSFALAFASGVTAIVLLVSNAASPAPKSAALDSPERRGFVTPIVGPTGGGLAGVVRF